MEKDGNISTSKQMFSNPQQIHFSTFEMEVVHE